MVISSPKPVHDWLKTYGVKISSVRTREKEMKHFISFWGPYPVSRITKNMFEERILELNEKYSQNYMDGIMLVNHDFAKSFI
ncbi:hypothetical protein V7150_10455 [Neobacillus drentensis]|uniref:hypothetical protein n=1 Tax=Neobacillus drentensis TaxID=220684 RepID=UPI002FFD85B8